VLTRESAFGPRTSDFRRLAALAILMCAVCPAWAQLPIPHIGYVYPAGGRQSSVFLVAVGGQFLDGVTNAHVSGMGVRAEVVAFNKPLTAQQANQLREKMQQLQEKRQATNAGNRKRGSSSGSSTNAAFTFDDQQMLMEIRRKLASFQRRPANPAIAETATLQITVSPDAEPGEREIRVGTQLGLSNPLLFCIGQLPEFSKKNSKLNEELLTFRPARNNNEQKAVPPTEMNIAIPAVVNGQVLQGGVDRYHFQGKQGQRLVVAVAARELIPYLPDAVPGWFQAALTLYDSKGHELAYADHYRFHPDPVICCELPKDGEYVAEIRDSIYRGREDFVYRITVGEVPYITSVFPLGGQANSTSTVQLEGWNLPTKTLTRANQEPGIYPLSVGKERFANSVPFAVDTLPEVLEQEPNHSPAAAQPVTLPVIINGRIKKPGDWDVFRFEGRAGDEVVAEVYARRLDSPLDSVLKLTDEAGNQLAFNDDNEDKGAGLNTHYADSWLRAKLPATGTYYVHIGDSQRQGGPEYGYRLRVSAPRPDFALRVVPASVNVRGGATVPITVFALRRDGFSGEIAVALKDAPDGFTLGGAKVPAGQDQVRLTLSAPPRATVEPIKLSLQGKATIEGNAVTHAAVPAEDMMQAFAYRHLVPARELDVAVSGRFMGRGGGLKILGSTPVKIPAGGTAHVLLGTPGGGFGNRFKLELSEPPEGITLAKVSPADEGAEMELHSDASKTKAGLKGNLIVNILPGQGAVAAQKAKKQNAQRRVVVGTLPAIPFEVVAP